MFLQKVCFLVVSGLFSLSVKHNGNNVLHIPIIQKFWKDFTEVFQVNSLIVKSIHEKLQFQSKEWGLQEFMKQI